MHPDDKNKRGEIKLTGTVAQNHTIQGGYLNNPRTRTNNSGIFSLIIDPAQRGRPQHSELVLLHELSGRARSDLLVEAQYSERRSRSTGGGTSDTNILDSPFCRHQLSCLYNAPYFDATDPEQRNNRQLTGSVTNFWNGGGRHETKAGYEWFRSQRTGGNSQSSTPYVFNSDFADRRGRRAACSIRPAG